MLAVSRGGGREELASCSSALARAAREECEVRGVARGRRATALLPSLSQELEESGPARRRDTVDRSSSLAARLTSAWCLS